MAPPRQSAGRERSCKCDPPASGPVSRDRLLRPELESFDPEALWPFERYRQEASCLGRRFAPQKLGRPFGDFVLNRAETPASRPKYRPIRFSARFSFRLLNLDAGNTFVGACPCPR